jgi:hypothetical protein
MPKHSKTLEKLVEADPRYDSYEFCEGEEYPHRLYLAKGWKSASDPMGEVHQGNGRTVQECREDARPIPCNCEWCQ